MKSFYIVSGAIKKNVYDKININVIHTYGFFFFSEDEAMSFFYAELYKTAKGFALQSHTVTKIDNLGVK